MSSDFYSTSHRAGTSHAYWIHRGMHADHDWFLYHDVCSCQDSGRQQGDKAVYSVDHDCRLFEDAGLPCTSGWI